MKLKVLEDNNTFIDNYYLGEPAVSYYIEDGNNKILFDTGYSDAFIKNANKMDINLNKLNKLVISHGHNPNMELIAHPESFNEKWFDNEYIGTSMAKDDLEKVCNLKLTKSPMKISDNIIFLGEIPNSNDFEIRESIGNCKVEGKIVDDFVNDDTAIVYKSEKGLFIITGCSHSGICNIIEYAKKVCGDNRIYGVIGGFHLFEANIRLYKTIEYFKENSISMLYPCHCVSLNAKIEIAKQIQINEVGVGLEIII